MPLFSRTRYILAPPGVNPLEQPIQRQPVKLPIWGILGIVWILALCCSGVFVAKAMSQQQPTKGKPTAGANSTATMTNTQPGSSTPMGTDYPTRVFTPTPTGTMDASMGGGSYLFNTPTSGSNGGIKIVTGTPGAIATVIVTQIVRVNVPVPGPVQNVPVNVTVQVTRMVTSIVTGTPMPTNTPWPTNTAWPTLTPWPTYTEQPTYTPYPTYTDYPTYTPYPTHTPTITPSPTITATAEAPYPAP